MGVVVVHVGRRNARIFQGAAHGLGAGLSTRAGAGNVVGVGRGTVAGQFSIDFCPAGLGVFQFFQDHHSTAFAHDKAAAVFVEWAGRLLGVVVELVGKGVHARKALDGIFRNAAFGASRQAHVQTAGPDGIQGDPDGVGAGGTGGAHRMGKARDTQSDGNVGTGLVGNQFRHGQRRYPPLAAFDILVVGLVKHVHSRKAVSGHDSRSVFGQLFLGESSVLDRLVGGSYQELGEAGHTAGFLGVDSVFFGLEILDFGSDFYGAIGGVKKGYGGDTALSQLDGLPHVGYILSDGSYGTDAGNDDSSLAHGIPFFLRPKIAYFIRFSHRFLWKMILRNLSKSRNKEKGMFL